MSANPHSHTHTHTHTLSDPPSPRQLAVFVDGILVCYSIFYLRREWKQMFRWQQLVVLWHSSRSSGRSRRSKSRSSRRKSGGDGIDGDADSGSSSGGGSSGMGSMRIKAKVSPDHHPRNRMLNSVRGGAGSECCCCLCSVVVAEILVVIVIAIEML